MTEEVFVATGRPAPQITEKLGIPEKPGFPSIGVLIMCGQGPLQDAMTKVKLASLEVVKAGLVSRPEANSWMKLIGRAAGLLDREGDVGILIPSGKATGGEYAIGLGNKIAPTEAGMMTKTAESISHQRAPQSEGVFTQAEVLPDPNAHNTLDNMINAANIIDARKAQNPNDPNLDNIWIIGAHFHLPRLRVLAALFGFDPGNVLRA